MDTGTLVAGFAISSIGLGFFLYGKKQRRAPQLVLGVLLSVLPFVVADPLWMSIAAIALVLGLRIALRYE